MGKIEPEKNWNLSDAEWKKKLSPEEYRVMREQGTEPAFTGKYDKFYEDGTYYCAACGQPLFSSEAKYNSKSGWPSFWEPIEEESVNYREDDHVPYMKRTEVVCSRCASHLGHVFDDGPQPTGQRYCMNSTSLKFRPSSDT